MCIVVTVDVNWSCLSDFAAVLAGIKTTGLLELVDSFDGV